MLEAHFTNRGKQIILDSYYRTDANDELTRFKIALVKVRSNAKTLDAAAAINKGNISNEVGIPITAHNYAVGERIVIDGTIHYDGTYTINSQTINEIVITSAYNAETFAGTENAWEIPSAVINVLSDLDEVDAGNGYVSGGSIAHSVARSDIIIEDDTNACGQIQLADVLWTASGGSIPNTTDINSYALFALLLDDAAIPNVICWWELISGQQATDGETLLLQGAEIHAVWI